MSPASAPDPIASAGNASSALVRVVNLSKEFPAGSTGIVGGTKLSIKAVAGVNLEIQPGETLGLVGESGSGKSTLGRLILKLLEPTQGTVYFDGRDLSTLGRVELRTLRQQMQLVFQDPYASLNPRRTIRGVLRELLRVHELASGPAIEARCVELMALVGLPPAALERRPAAFSGGQRQRIAIARTLAAEPSVIVLDEPLASLDASAQAQLANLLVSLSRELGLGLLLISHDLAIVRHVADSVSVMYLGLMVEQGETRSLWELPLHPYSEALIK